MVENVGQYIQMDKLYTMGSGILHDLISPPAPSTLPILSCALTNHIVSLLFALAGHLVSITPPNFARRSGEQMLNGGCRVDSMIAGWGALCIVQR